MRIAGIDIPDNKRGEIALTYIYGLGRSSAIKILNTAGISVDKKVSEWTEEESNKIRNLISTDFKIEGDLKSEVRLNLIRTLSEASGLKGMVLGQSKDLEAEKNNKLLELKDIINLQKLKTGALFNWSLKSANILAEQNHDSLEKYADSIGLAFQIKDDLLDHEGTMEKTGKKVGKDNAAGKATLVSLLGVENAKKRCLDLCEEACDSLDFFGAKSEILKTAARFTIERGF